MDVESRWYYILHALWSRRLIIGWVEYRVSTWALRNRKLKGFGRWIGWTHVDSKGPWSQIRLEPLYSIFRDAKSFSQDHQGECHSELCRTQHNATIAVMLCLSTAQRISSQIFTKAVLYSASSGQNGSQVVVCGSHNGCWTVSVCISQLIWRGRANCLLADSFW